jgi:hypothetical protein
MAMAAIFFFIVTACVFIPHIGIEEDEVLFAPSIYQPVPEYSLQIAGRFIPLMLVDYTGADKIYLYAAILKVMRPTLWALRLPMVLAGALSLWFLFSAARRFTGEYIAIALVWLIAADPIFLLTTTFDWGPVAIQHLCIFAALALFALPRPRVFGGFLMLGLALWNKGTVLWILAAMGLSALLFLWQDLRVYVSMRNTIRAAAGFVIGALPFLVFNLTSHWATFANNGHFTTAGLMGKVWIMSATLNGRGMFNYIVRGSPPAWYSLTPVGVAAALALLFSRKASAVRRVALFFLSTGLLIWAGMLFTQNGGTSVHHTVLVWPWPQLFALSVLGFALGRKPFIAAALALVVSNIVMTGFYAERMFRAGPTSWWSEASLGLPEVLPKTARITTVEWGISNIVIFLTRGTVPIHDITFSGLTDEDLAQMAGTEFLAHVPGEEMTEGANARFDAAIAKAGYVRVIDRVIADRRGRPLIEAFHCSPRAP